MGIILDLIVVAIIAVMVFISAKHGFVRTLIEVVGFVAALFVAFTFSTPIANVTYDKIIAPAVVTAVEGAANDATQSAADAVMTKVPSFISNNAESFGLSSEQLSQKISDGVNISETAANISDNLIKPIAVKVLGLVISTIMIVVLLFVVNTLAKLLNKVFSFSLVGKLNRTLGGVVGFFKGILIATVFCMIVGVIVSFTNNGFLIFTRESIEASTIFGTICDMLPFFK